MEISDVLIQLQHLQLSDYLSTATQKKVSLLSKGFFSLVSGPLSAQRVKVAAPVVAQVYKPTKYKIACSGYDHYALLNSLPSTTTFLVWNAYTRLITTQTNPQIQLLLSLDARFPKLRELKIRSSSHYSLAFIHNLPATLTHLSIMIPMANADHMGEYDHLPAGLVYLKVYQMFGRADNLPDNLQHLHIEALAVSRLDYLPPYLKSLTISSNLYGGSIMLDYLPAQLSTFSIDGANFNSTIDHLPEGLKKLIIRSKIFNQPVDHLSQGLRVLKLLGYFNRSVDFLPANLEVLVLGTYSLLCVLVTYEMHVSPSFSKHVDHLPDTLLSLTLDYKYSHNLENLPEGLVVLKFKKDRKVSRYLPNRVVLKTISQPFLHLSAFQRRLFFEEEVCIHLKPLFVLQLN